MTTREERFKQSGPMLASYRREYRITFTSDFPGTDQELFDIIDSEPLLSSGKVRDAGLLLSMWEFTGSRKGIDDFVVVCGEKQSDAPMWDGKVDMPAGPPIESFKIISDDAATSENLKKLYDMIGSEFYVVHTEGVNGIEEATDSGGTWYRPVAGLRSCVFMARLVGVRLGDVVVVAGDVPDRKDDAPTVWYYFKYTMRVTERPEGWKPELPFISKDGAYTITAFDYDLPPEMCKTKAEVDACLRRAEHAQLGHVRDFAASLRAFCRLDEVPDDIKIRAGDK